MRAGKRFAAAALGGLLLFGAVSAAWAHDWRIRPRASVGVYIGPGWHGPGWHGPGWYGPRPWGWGGPAYWYAPPPVWYSPPPVVVTPPSPPVYIERGDDLAQNSGPVPGWWYYCRSPAGYFPQVQECPGGWERVAPHAPPPNQPPPVSSAPPASGVAPLPPSGVQPLPPAGVQPLPAPR